MKLLKNRLFLFSMALLAVLHPIFNYSFRLGYIFIDMETFTDFSYVILFLMLFNAVLWTFLYIKRKIEAAPPKKVLYILYSVGIVFQLLFLIVNIAFLVVGKDSYRTFYIYLSRMLPYLAVFFLSIFLIYAYPNFKRGLAKAVALVLSGAIPLTLFMIAFNPLPLRFESEPCVFITDNEEYYSIVWATNHNATGFVEYTYNNRDFTVYDSFAGNIRSDSKIHTVQIPKQHIEGNTYKVSSQRVKEHLGNSARKGKLISSNDFEFKKYEQGEPVTVLSFSDWHENVKNATKVASYLSEPDLFFVVGDALDMITNLDNIVDYLLVPAAKISKSSCPVVFARGNHETRGENAVNLARYLGLNSYYFPFTWGPVWGIVLDSGEDKPDNHPEYGGLAAFEPYLEAQTKWLSNLDSNGNFDFSIALCHIPNMPIEWTHNLNRLGTDIAFAGHNHNAEIQLANSENQRNFPLIKDGGRQGKLFTGTQAVFENGEVHLKALNNLGEIIIEKTIGLN